MIHLKRLYAHNFKQLQEIELRFPDHARVLVQGKNEAGKSTLFEALFFALFGNALATETGARGLDDLIRYGVEKARVELDAQVGARLFQIKRTITRGKSNVWELDIVLGDAVEEIRGNTVVNKRLVAELGFDGDALLNTCFVEQKKLEKLEGMSKAKREESLAKLLNLDALVQIENDLKLRGEDKQDLDRLKKRADLAEIQAELPAHEEKLVKVEQQLKLMDLRGAVNGAVEEMRAVEKLDTDVRTLAAQRDQLAQRVERIDALKEAMLSVKEARDAVERANDSTREIERLKQEHADAQRAGENIPNLQARSRGLQRLACRLARVEQIRAAKERHTERIKQIAEAEARIVELNTTIAREEELLVQAEARLQQYGIGQVLGEWIAAQSAIAPAHEIENTVKSKQATRDRIARQFRLEVYGLAVLLLICVIAGAIALTFLPLLAIAFFALGALAVIVFAVRALILWCDLSRAAEDFGQAEGEARARQAIAEDQNVRLKEIESQLSQMGAEIPATIDLAQSQRVLIAREMNNQTKDELLASKSETHERLLNARAMQNTFGDPAKIAAEREQSACAAHKAERMIEIWQARLTDQAQSFGVVLDANTIQRARYQLDAEINQTQRRANDTARFAQDIARRQKQAEAFWTRAREAYGKATAAKPSVPAWSVELGVEAYTSFGKELRAEYDGLGGEQSIKQARDIEGNLGRRQGERETRARNAQMLVARTQELLAELGQANALPAAPSPDDLTELGARLKTLNLNDEGTLRAQHREFVGRVHSLRDRQAQLERELGLTGEMLNRVECRNAWIEQARHHLVRERGMEIVSVARRRIVHKVLPATMDYMRQILPTITRDRYHDAQLDPESYKIQVWDERASDSGAFKEKNIFSGGTKDQFSLALRLAFALATLPQNRGTAPSFIFLDEPLGSFDDERAEALIYLLTEGEIARAFDQIFLISHVHVNERLFTHRVVLENGRIAETDLPAE